MNRSILVLCFALGGCMPLERSVFDDPPDGAVDVVVADGEDRSDNPTSNPDAADVALDHSSNDGQVNETGADASDGSVDVADAADAYDVADTSDADGGTIVLPDVVMPTDNGMVDVLLADVGTDTGTDQGPPDMGVTPIDVPVDVNTPDVGFDAGVDVPIDHGTPDTGPADTGFDAGVDVSADRGPTDTGVDVPVDMGTPDTGPVCGDNMCTSGETCATCTSDCGPRYDPITIVIDGAVGAAMAAGDTSRPASVDIRIIDRDAANTPVSSWCFASTLPGSQCCIGGLLPIAGGGGFTCLLNVQYVRGRCYPWLQNYGLHIVPRTRTRDRIFTSRDPGTPGAVCYPTAGRMDCITVNCSGVDYTAGEGIEYRSTETDPSSGGQLFFLQVGGRGETQTVCARSSPSP